MMLMLKSILKTRLSTLNFSDVDSLRQTKLFDAEYYLATYPDVVQKGLDAKTHYLNYGAKEMRSPSAFFDPNYYLSQCDDLDLNCNPLLHYLKNCWSNFISPNPYFDQRWYVETNNISEDSALTPADHYLSQSYPFKFDPSPVFSNSQYNFYNPDVSAAQILPLKHYLQSGRLEKRQVIGRVRSRIPIYEEIPKQSRALLLVLFSPDGNLSSYQLQLISTYRAQGFFVITILNSGAYNSFSRFEISNDAHIFMVRENIGFDFGAWAHALSTIGGLKNRCISITFTNDSIIPLDLDKTDAFRLVEQHESGVVFLSENKEVTHHYQSYFFSFYDDFINKYCHDVFEQFQGFMTKDEAIYSGEIGLTKLLKAKKVNISTIFRLNTDKNPTIHNWEELIKMGFPFLKMQLFQLDQVHFKHTNIRNLLGDKFLSDIKDHLAGRHILSKPKVWETGILPTKAIKNYNKFGPLNEAQAFNFSPAHNPSLKLPFKDKALESDLQIFGKTLIVLHCFYLDEAVKMINKLEELEIPGLLLCTTDTEDKAKFLISELKLSSLKFKVVKTPNKGRDIAPFVVEGAKYFRDYDYVLHLHTKKSPHGAEYAEWSEFLLNNLIKDKNTIASILSLMKTNSAGLVYSTHFDPISKLRNWGFDFSNARDLLYKLGIKLSLNQILEFPTGSMFWARSDALKPLFELQIKYDDFPEESGQIDGTLAHSIERILLHICEHSGYRHISVTTSHAQSGDEVVYIEKTTDLNHLDIPRPRILESFGYISDYQLEFPELRPVQVIKSYRPKPRFNFVIPTADPKKVYGGITTAIDVGKKLIKEFGNNFTLRIVVTSDYLNQDALDYLSEAFGHTIMKRDGNDDQEYASATSLVENGGCPITLRSQDIFFATAWWTADFAFGLIARQNKIFGSSFKLIYLIQDYEPGFYSWSKYTAAARATMQKAESTIAIINSEELANFITQHHKFEASFCLPYKLNTTIASSYRPTSKEDIILVYGRPSVERNHFDLIVAGLNCWIDANPDKVEDSQIIFVGENFENSVIDSLPNARNLGKLSLEDYANLLSRAAIGISLMESPHPSYPPLEMASCGCITITNEFDGKQPALRSKNLIALSDMTPDGLSKAIDRAYGLVRIGERKELTALNSLPMKMPIFDAKKVVEDLSAKTRREK